MRTAALLLLVALPTVHARADEPRDHWAWKVPTRPAVPTVEGEPVANPIDAFVRAKLVAAKLTPAPPATRERLIRRATFDLHGLPPTPEEIDAFVADKSPEAFAKVVDRLLASPRYGERWGRHWLDLARYADTNGYEFDEPRPDAWRYRDYVIRSLNDDKPFDRFIREQLAGDELYPDDPDARIATGFNLLGPDMTDSADQARRRYNTLTDMTDTSALAFLGLTITCARCHDHKFEPISQKDYFRLQAFFTPATFRADVPAAPREFTGVPKPVAMGLTDKPGPPAKTFLLERGEIGSKGEEVQPGFPAVLLAGGKEAVATVKALPASTGRRAALANWIASPDNPLTARVLVNRLWQHHFGKGIVATASDFGLRGQRPTYPELLDWLSTEFVAGGWKLKHLHRLMLLSETYRQSTKASKDAEERDPDNKLLSHTNRLRLEGEAVRDSLLMVSGRLNTKAGGPGVVLPEASRAVGGSRPVPVTADATEYTRRSVYLFQRRNLKLALLESFDLPDSNLSCPKRERSTTATQALALLNANETMTAAKALADRLTGEAKTETERIALAYRLTLGRAPSSREVERATAFLKESPLSELCRALFNVNEFVYLD